MLFCAMQESTLILSLPEGEILSIPCEMLDSLMASMIR